MTARPWVSVTEVHIYALDALLGWQDGFDVHIRVDPRPPSPARRVLWFIGPVSDVVDRPAAFPRPPMTPPTTRRDLFMQLLDSQQVVLSVAGKDKAGNLVDIPGSLIWTVSDESVAALVDNGDGTRTLVTTGELGSVVVTVTDDVQDDGSVDFQGSLAVDVLSGPVTEIDVSAAEPTDRAA